MIRGLLSDVEVVATGLEFPEGPVVLSDGSVLVVEINGGRLSRIDPTDGSSTLVAALGGGPNGAAIGPDGAVYVCNNGGIGDPSAVGSIQRVDLADGSFETLYAECDGRGLIAPNDLVFDAAGGFWFTDHGARGKRNAKFGGLLYALADGSQVSERITTIDAPNGVGLSPDGSIVYYSETPSGRLMRRRVASPGVLEPTAGLDVWSAIHGQPLDPWILLGRRPDHAMFDSLAVEAGGRICVGTLLEPGISVFDPDDGSLEHLGLPEGIEDLMITNICFAGDDLTTAYLTASQHGMLLRCSWPRPGLPLAFSI